MSQESVALYARVSTKFQNCDVQLTNLREWCSRHGYSVYNVYEDIGISGRTSKRPALQRLMSDARDGRFKTVVVYSLCRFGRNLSDVINGVLELSAIGVRFVSLMQGIDTNDKSPMAKFTLQMFALLAEFEVDLTAERISDGIQRAKQYGSRTGNPIGRPIRIFRRDKVFEMRQAGFSLLKIAHELGIGYGTVRRTLAKKPLEDSGQVSEDISTDERLSA